MSIQVLSQNVRGETLNEVVDDVLTHIFGHVATQIIYNYLENNHSIQRNEIAQKLESFNRALEEYLGTGAVVIERKILESLDPSKLEGTKNVDFSKRQRILKLA